MTSWWPASSAATRAQTLEARARQYTLPSYRVVRARLVVCAAEGRANDEIAQALSVGRDVVSL